MRSVRCGTGKTALQPDFRCHNRDWTYRCLSWQDIGSDRVGGQWNVPSFRFLNTPTKLKDVYCLERSLQDTALVATRNPIPAQHAQRSCPS